MNHFTRSISLAQFCLQNLWVLHKGLVSWKWLFNPSFTFSICVREELHLISRGRRKWTMKKHWQVRYLCTCYLTSSPETWLSSHLPGDDRPKAMTSQATWPRQICLSCLLPSLFEPTL
jgi:hypothetical protein